MKNKILTIVVFILFVGSIGYIFGTAGASDCNLITLEQCAWRVFKGLVVLAIDVLLVSYLGNEEGKKKQKSPM